MGFNQTELLNYLLENFKEEDIPDRYRHLIDAVGIENVIKLCKIAKGDELYFPTMSSLLLETKYRLIYEEYKAGKTKQQLAKKYSLTIARIRFILKQMKNRGDLQ